MSVLSLADVRWRSRRDPKGGPPHVHVSFLHATDDPRTAAAAGGIVQYFISLAGRPRRDYDPTVPDTIAGDRRLGRGLAAVCQTWFRWEALTIAETAPPHVHEALSRSGIESPSALRLRLFDLANERYAGFVPSARREEALASLATSLGLAPSDAQHLDRVLVLDSEAEAVLRSSEPPPSAGALVAAYNRAALAALLRQSERLVFTLHAPKGGLLRRLYSLCHHLGVYCDVERAGLLDDAFRLTLAGPEAVVAPPAAAGQRLATVALRLLRGLGPLDRAVADLVLHGRPYRFPLDRAILQVPGLAADAPAADSAEEGEMTRAADAGGSEHEEATFDSEVEARLVREFAALRRQGRATGWRLVREPAPLLAGRRVLLPDFALVRGETRVFVEVAGFWTEGYLTKKRQALEQLPPETPLLLAVAPPAATALAGLPFPMVPYRTTVPVTRLLAEAEARYGDFAARTAGATERLAAACASAATGRLPDETLAALLGCFSPGEVARILAATPAPAGWTYLPGAGLTGPSLHNALDSALADAWATRGPDGRLSLAELRAILPDAALPEGDEALAALLERRPSCSVVRDSLFAVDLRPPGVPPTEHDDGDRDEHTPPKPRRAPAGRSRAAAAAGRPPRRRRAGSPAVTTPLF